MLTGKMVRVRLARNNIVPHYLDTADPVWLAGAERLLQIFHAQKGQSRGELEREIRENFGDAPNQQIYQGLAKLIEDRSEFTVVSAEPPELVRAKVFAAATRLRLAQKKLLLETGETGHRDAQAAGTNSEGEKLRRLRHSESFDRAAVLSEVADRLGMTAEQIDASLFADLKSEQRLSSFKDMTPEQLLQRYNVALAQAVLLRAVSVEIKIRNEPPRRYRQLLRLMKFHRLLCAIERVVDDVYTLKLDGPLSLFSSTQKYGLQLALFLPAVLQCREFELTAEVLWGPQRRPKKFALSSKDGLVSHHTDQGMYVPSEVAMFVELFHNRISDWQIREETELLPLGTSFWAPDYQLIHEATGQVVYLEILGYWRRSSIDKHLQLLRRHATAPFVLAVSEKLQIDESEVDGLPANIYRFRQMPIPKEVVAAAAALL